MLLSFLRQQKLLLLSQQEKREAAHLVSGLKLMRGGRGGAGRRKPKRKQNALLERVQSKYGIGGCVAVATIVGEFGIERLGQL